MAEKQTSTELAVVEDAPLTEAVSTDIDSMMLTDTGFNQVMRMADVMAKGVSTIPKHLQGNPSDCAAIIIQARSWDMSPYAVAQKTHLVNGTLGYEAQLIHAVILKSGVFQGRPHFVDVGNWESIEGKQTKYGDAAEKGLGIKVIATLSDGTTCEHTCFLSTCKVRNSPNWTTKPKVQCSYQAIKEFARLHTPDVILGVYSNDELDPQASGRIQITEINEASSRTDALESLICDKPEVTVEPESIPPAPEPTEDPKPKKPTKSAVIAAVGKAGLSDQILNDYLLDKGKIKEGQGYIDASPDLLRRIVDNPKGVADAVKAWAEEA